MNINVTRTEVIVGNGYIVNKGEYKINPCVFTFSQEYTNLVKKAVFDDGKTTKEIAIINNKCDIPYEVLDSDSFQLRVYAYRVNEQELELVYSPTPAIIYLREGSYRGVTGSGEVITATQFEQYEQALNNGLNELEEGLNEVANVDIDVSKTGTTATVTITDRQGTEKSVEIFDGDDYVLTEEDKQEIINTVEAEVSLDIPTKVSQLENDSAYINKEVNNLTNYTLKTNTGSSIELSINNSTYVMTLNLKNASGTVISTGTVDLPLETMVVGATYDNTNKKIVLTLKNGTTIDVPVADLVSGLQSEITNANKLSADLVDDTNHTNKFVTASEKEQITTNATDISNIKDGTSIDSFGDVETALSGKEDKSNKVTTLSSSSTDTQYPSAKTVYDNFVTRDEEIEKLQTENAQLLADHPDILDENNEFPTGTDLTLQDTGDLKMKVDVGGNSTQDNLPSEYQQVEYIESSGTQYIDTGFIPDYINGYQIEVDFAPNKLGYRYSMLSGYDEQNALCLEITTSNQGRIYCYNGAVGVSIGTITTQRNTFRVKFKNSIFTYSVNDSSNSISYSSAATVNESLYMFLDRQLRYSIFSQPLKIYMCKLYNNDVLVRNFIPCYRKSDNEIGLYDLVNGVFYDNDGTGTFNKGNNTNIPNPSYPQDINNVEGDVVVKGSSKNLWDLGTYLNGFCAIRTDGSWQTGTGTSYAFETSKLSDTIIINIVNGNRSNISYWNELPSTTKVFADYFVPNNFVTLPRSFSVDKNYKYIIIQVAYNINVNTLSNGQLEEGSTLGDYIEPQSNTVTFPLSQGQKLMLGDTLEDDGIHHKRGKIILDGTENDWSFKSYSNAPFGLTINDIKPSTSNDKIPNIKSSHFIPVAWNAAFVNYDSLIAISNTLPNIINFKYKDISTLEEFKTWLAQQYANNTPVILEYELETEIIEPYTQEQQTAYNKLKEMQSYYDLTYVTGSSDNAQPIITAHAKKSLKVIQDEIDNIESRLSLLE